MALIASESQQKTYPPAPEGTHIARCIMLVDMGTQLNPLFGKWARKARIAFELPNEKAVFDETKGAEPYVVGNNFSLSLDSKSNLRKFLKGWRGRDFTADELKAFDLKTILDKPCLLTLGHKHKTTDSGDRVYAELLNVSPLMKGMDCPPRILPLICYEIEQGKSCAAFESLPEWMRKEIEKCREWTNPPIQNTASQIDDNDVPEMAMAGENNSPF
jgi:hypothetical protein